MKIITMKMMKKKMSKYFVILAVGLFFACPVLATDLEAEFEKDPLFKDVNFLPGQTITRWAKVTNNNGQSQRIAVEAINVSNSEKLGDALILKITENGNLRYEKDLSRFFEAGEVYLSDLDSGETTVYDFTVSFWPETKNSFQGKSLGFDILIGFQGEGGGLPPGSGSGGGGGLPSGLTITEPVSVVSGKTTAEITWTTNYSSTSSVIYDDDSGQFSLADGDPNYGYQWVKEGDDSGDLKVIHHTVTLTGLDSNKTYYYRCVSHGSFAVSTEYSFTTLEKEEREETNSKQDQDKINADQSKRNPFLKSEKPEQKEEIEEDQKKKEDKNNEKKELSQGILNSLFATVGDWFKDQDICWLLVLLAAVLIFLFFWAIKKGKIEKNKLYWFLGLIVIALLVLYYLYCPFAKIVVLAIVLVSFIVYIAMMLKA